MSEKECKDSSVTKRFTAWKAEEKLKGDGSNFFKVLRKLSKQLKAEALSGKASCLEKYPATPYILPYPLNNSWIPKPADGTTDITLDEGIISELKKQVFKDYLSELKAYAKQDQKIYELFVQDVNSEESMAAIKVEAEWAEIDGKIIQDDWVKLYNLMVKTHIIQSGGNTAESKTVVKTKVKKDLESFKQNANTKHSRPFFESPGPNSQGENGGSRDRRTGAEHLPG